ncbi:MAG: hypothetical protein GHCLOJNM_01577 [bacterium]|nr:hypothetical protein [bacterium]
MTVVELREQRARAFEQAKALVEKCEKENRDFSAEENEQYVRINAEIDSLGARVQRMEAAEARERELASTSARGHALVTPGNDGASAASVADRRATPEYAAAFWDDFVRRGMSTRALQAFGSASEGGYLIPTTTLPQLIPLVREANVMRQLATVLTTSNPTEIPTVATNATAAYKAEELSFGGTDPEFGQKSLTAHKLTCLIKVSEELLQDSAFDVQEFVLAQMAEAIGAEEERAFVAGTGSGEPTGVVGSATVGVTMASATALTSDEILDLYHSLPPRFRRGPSVGWIVKDSTALKLRKLKTGGSQDYIWQPGLTAGDPDRLLGKPIYVSDNVPASTANLKAIVFGDLKKYWIADRSPIVVQRLAERYADTGQVGFKAWSRHDGLLTDALAVVVGQMHA